MHIEALSEQAGERHVVAGHPTGKAGGLGEGRLCGERG